MRSHWMSILVACLVLSSTAIRAQNPNTAYGTLALSSTQPNINNSAFGYSALRYNTTGIANTAVGVNSLVVNGTGYSNTAVGVNTLANNSTGYNNIAIGNAALYGNFTGFANVAIGDGALTNTSTGQFNIGIGNNAGAFITTGTNNIDIGHFGSSSDYGVIRIGSAGNQTSFYAAGVSGVSISDGIPVYINGEGQLGTVNSSVRFKEDIHDMADASSKLFELRPVTYRYKQVRGDGSKPMDYGLIAEEVAHIYPDMVARDSSGEILSVQYQKLTPMLLNEVQKQHHQLEMQQEIILALEQRLSAVEATRVADH